MSVLGDIQTRAAAHPAHIVLSEGHDPRIVAAAVRAVALGIATITLVGETKTIAAALATENAAMSDQLMIADPATSSMTPQIVQTVFALRSHKGITKEQATELAKDPMVYAAALVHMGFADGTVGGAVATTGAGVGAGAGADVGLPGDTVGEGVGRGVGAKIGAIDGVDSQMSDSA